MSRLLITGGAGFIGSHTADALIAQGDDVRVLDVLDPQVHGREALRPKYLNSEVDLVRADVRDEETLERQLEWADAVFHFAAQTGVGQSMYQVRAYLDSNVMGTAALLEVLARRTVTIERLVLASSRAVYGEGSYRCTNCGVVHPDARSPASLRAGLWELTCPRCAADIVAIPTSEDESARPASVYALSKLTQEQACLVVGAAYDIPTVVLRYFNVFGPRQAPGNPYTGIITTFSNVVRSGRTPEVFEDGEESRDFVYVSDVVKANLLAMKVDGVAGMTFNVGSGERTTLYEVATAIAEELDGHEPVVTQKFRVGDVRHCFADIGRSRTILGYEPTVSFRAGLRRLVAEGMDVAAEDLSVVAEQELRARGLSSTAAP
jgi:dTDP-L-rhamnose 4-epimerase